MGKTGFQKIKKWQSYTYWRELAPGAQRMSRLCIPRFLWALPSPVIPSCSGMFATSWPWAAGQWGLTPNWSAMSVVEVDQVAYGLGAKWHWETLRRHRAKVWWLLLWVRSGCMPTPVAGAVWKSYYDRRCPILFPLMSVQILRKSDSKTGLNVRNLLWKSLMREKWAGAGGDSERTIRW